MLGCPWRDRPNTILKSFTAIDRSNFILRSSNNNINILVHTGINIMVQYVKQHRPSLDSHKTTKRPEYEDEMLKNLILLLYMMLLNAASVGRSERLLRS